jgi:hypothetical protein
MSSTSGLLIVGTKPKTIFFSGGHTWISATSGVHTEMNEVYGQNACAYAQTHIHTHTEGGLEAQIRL